jgi:hypothetical protein
VTGKAIHIYKNVTIETDPRLGIINVITNSTRTTTSPARATINGNRLTVEGMFRVSDSAKIIFSRVYLEGGIGSRGGCIYIYDGFVELNDVIIRNNIAIKGGTPPPSPPPSISNISFTLLEVFILFICF